MEGYFKLHLHYSPFNLKFIKKLLDLLELSPHDRTKLLDNPSIHFQAEIHQFPGSLELSKTNEDFKIDTIDKFYKKDLRLEEVLIQQSIQLDSPYYLHRLQEITDEPSEF